MQDTNRARPWPPSDLHARPSSTQRRSAFAGHRRSPRVAARICGVALLTCGALLLVAMGAQASITQTAITSPASSLFFVDNLTLTTQPTVTIDGTTNSTAPATDTVNLICYQTEPPRSNPYTHVNEAVIAEEVPLDSAGTFSWTGTPPPDGSCLLRAVPTGWSTSRPLTGFPALPVHFDEASVKLAGGEGSPAIDFSANGAGVYGEADFSSAGDCGLSEFIPIHPDNDSYDTYPSWNCPTDALAREDGSGQRTDVLVDGEDAYLSWGAASAYPEAAEASGLPGIAFSDAVDPSDGVSTLTDREQLVACAEASFPATAAKCGGNESERIPGAWQSTGVSLERTIEQSDEGQLVTITNVYRSTDDKAHNLNLEIANTPGTSPFPAGNLWRLPESSGWEAYGPRDEPGLGSSSAGAIYVRDLSNVDGSTQTGDAALVFHSLPDSARLTEIGYDTAMLLNYRRAIPAAGSTTIVLSYVAAFDIAQAEKVANSVLDEADLPAVSITAPSNGTVSQQAAAQVSGTASAHDGLALEVDGEAVTVNPDGTWSTVVALKPGPNTITAKVSDGAGNTAETNTTIAYSPPTFTVTPTPLSTVANTPLTFCIVPDVAHHSLAKAKQALALAHCGVGKVSQAHSNTFHRGRIEHASYGLGVILTAGTKVGLTESSGPPRPKPTEERRPSDARAEYSSLDAKHKDPVLAKRTDRSSSPRCSFERDGDFLPSPTRRSSTLCEA